MDGIHLMATAMHAAQAELDVSAANLANVSSDGFRKRVAHASLTTAGGLVVTTERDATQAPLRHTGRAFDVAVAGPGSFSVRDASGAIVAVRSASLETDARGELVDDRGRVVLGSHGPIVASADATIDTQGVVRDAGRVVGKIALTPSASLESGFLVGTSVDGMHEMVAILSAQRAFETAQKTLSALDEQRQKDADDVARIKA
jgi:flagellar basal-body rod protein FlgG